MEFKAVADKQVASDLFKIAHSFSHENQNNYSQQQLETSWDEWIYFYCLIDGDNVVAFCGSRAYNHPYTRIFDRYFVMPEYRKQGIAHAEYSLLMVQQLVDDAKMLGYVPFFSIQEARKRNALKIAVKKFNKVLRSDTQLQVLDDLYCTFPQDINNEKTWQNIASLNGYDLDLPRRKII